MINTLMHAEADPCRNAANVKPTPLAPQTRRPEHVVRLAPNWSAVRPANGRLSNVATYCALMTSPATNGL
jgi:hypothetical protein